MKRQLWPRLKRYHFDHAEQPASAYELWAVTDCRSWPKRHCSVLPPAMGYWLPLVVSL